MAQGTRVQEGTARGAGLGVTLPPGCLVLPSQSSPGEGLRSCTKDTEGQEDEGQVLSRQLHPAAGCRTDTQAGRGRLCPGSRAPPGQAKGGEPCSPVSPPDLSHRALPLGPLLLPTQGREARWRGGARRPGSGPRGRPGAAGAPGPPPTLSSGSAFTPTRPPLLMALGLLPVSSEMQQLPVASTFSYQISHT